MTANRLREFCREPGLLSATDWTLKHSELLVLLKSMLMTITHTPELLIRKVGLVFYLLLKNLPSCHYALPFSI